MSYSTLQGIVLKRQNSGENDRRLTVLTKEEGVTDIVAKGARKSTSRFSGSSEPLSVSIFQLAAGKRNRFLSQVQPITSFPGIRTSFDRLNYSLALCELAAAVLPHGKPVIEEFDFMLRVLKFFEVHEKPIVNYVWAQVHLLSLAGFLPNFNSCVVTGSKITSTPAYVSPHAGGYVVPESVGTYSDRFAVRAEVLYGLAALSQLELPPGNMKFVEEAALTLVPFWSEITGRPIPATESVALEIRSGLSGGA